MIIDKNNNFIVRRYYIYIHHNVCTGSVGSIAAKSPAQIDSSPRIITIDTTVCEPIDETHPAVMRLIEAGFSVEQSIEAVERCGGDLGTALDYLENLIINEGEIEDEGKLLPSSYKHELSYEDSQSSSEDIKMEWYVHRLCYHFEDKKITLLYFKFCWER